jgi:tetratricopeptide (TPR) repeat protein
MSKRFFYILLLSSILFSCHGAKYYLKEAQRYEKEKDYDNAVANYAEAYSIDPSDRDAKKGFKKTGQKLLDQLIDNMQETYNNKNYKDAMDQYQKIDKYYNKVKDRGIDLNFPDSIRNIYSQSKQNYASGLYSDASAAITVGNYSKAKTSLDELRQLDPGYEGLQALEKALVVDPMYMDGLNAYNKGQKLIAIQYFTKVNNQYPGYRETTTYLNELSKLPKQSISFFPIENKSRELGLDRLVYKGVERKLLEMQSALFTVADETMVQNELLKANKNSQPPYDDNTIVQISKTLGVTKAVQITVSDLTEDPLANSESFQMAYVREKVVYWDPYYGQTTNYQWRETKYKEIEEGVKYAIFIKLRIFDPVTGALVYNDIITKSVISKVKYAKYDGDYNDIYPTMGYISQTELNKWRARFTAVSDKKSKEELINILVKSANEDITDVIFSKLN